MKAVSSAITSVSVFARVVLNPAIQTAVSARKKLQKAQKIICNFLCFFKFGLFSGND